MKRVHIIAPSGKLDMKLIDGAKAQLEAWGYLVTEGEHLRLPEGRFGGSVEGRRADVLAAIQDPTIDFVLCARGGYGVAQLLGDELPLPEMGKVTKMPVFIGFSDITALHNWLGKKDIPSLHGVMCKHLSEYDTHRESCDMLHAAMEGAALEYSLPHHPLNREGKATGMLRGGNLSVFYGLQGTPWAIRTDEPFILFIEDVGERPYAIDRMMQNLRLSGVLAKASGLIIGQFSDYEEDPLMGKTVYERIREMVEPYDYPVLFDFPAGHVETNLPLWMNTPCEMEIKKSSGTVSFRNEE